MWLRPPGQGSADVSARLRPSHARRPFCCSAANDKPLEGPISTEPRINDRIRVPEVRLVGPAGEQVGIVRVEDALRLAAEHDLDLVEVAPQARPPVCKLMDYGKFKYEAAQKIRDARKNQTNTITKEMKLKLRSITIDSQEGTFEGTVSVFVNSTSLLQTLIKRIKNVKGVYSVSRIDRV